MAASRPTARLERHDRAAVGLCAGAFETGDDGRVDIAEFIAARYDDIEQTARDAGGATVIGTPGNWHPAPTGDEWEASRGPGGDEELLVALRPGLPRPPNGTGGYWGAAFSNTTDDCDPDAWSPMPRLEHMALHDPAAVLRDLASKRALLAMHEGEHYCPTDPDGGRSTYYNYLSGWAEEKDHPQICPVHRLLAAPFAAHADYKAEWSLT